MTESWLPVDLGPYLRGEITRPEPAVGIARRDGLRLLYAGKEHTVMGEMESGKSWFAAACVAAELRAGNDVVYVHFEEADPLDTIERLRAIGVPDDVLVDRFRFVGPNEPVDAYALAALLEPAPSLVVLDGVNEAMSMNQWKIREEDGAAAFRARLVKPCTAVGAAVLGCDHVVKDPEGRGRTPLGSIHKGNGLTGSLIHLENREAFGRGRRGCSYVFVTKDRPGQLRREGQADRKTSGKFFMGSLLIADTVFGLDVAFIEPQPQPDETDQAETQDAADDDRVYAAVAQLEADGQTPNLRNLRGMRLGIRKDRIDDSLARLTVDRKITEQPGSRGSRVFATVARAESSEVGP